jgi:hypothetical protein
VAGWSELVKTCKTNADNFALWRPLSDPGFPWLGILIASPIVGLWYWCTDQYIVQRALSAKDLATARRGALFGGLLKVWPVLIFLIPGMIGWALDKKFNAAANEPVLTRTYSVDLSKEERKKIVAEANERLQRMNAAAMDGRKGFYIPRELKEVEIKTDSGFSEAGHLIVAARHPGFDSGVLAGSADELACLAFQLERLVVHRGCL